VEVSQAPTSIVPTGTQSGTLAWLPTTIAVQATPTAADATATTASGIPTNLPQVISAPQGAPVVPEESTLVQVGFQFPLNYAFVVKNPTSSAQIFMYLPQGISDALSLKADQVTMHSLAPFDTQSTYGFITTLATFYIPSNMVSTLKNQIKSPISPLYHNPNESVFNITKEINNGIDLIPGNQMVEGGSVPGTSNSGAKPTTSTPAQQGGNGLFDPSAQNAPTPGSKTTTAGIAVGAIGAAAAYGAAMFFIARRYKRKRSSHRRTSSIQSPADMRNDMRFTGSPALMGGAVMSGGLDGGRDSRGSGQTGPSVGQSARTAGISGPLMAENSLGWN
jgi:hypothetical protein